MKHFRCLIVLLAMAGACLPALRAQESPADSRLTIGADIRVRFTHIDRDALFPDGVGEHGPAVEYLRVRERLWLGYQIAPDILFKARLVNQWRAYSSNLLDPNDREIQTWRAPDEVIFDEFNLTIANIGDVVDLTVGRQAIIFGNGMLVCEGTPMDAGRTIYYDGIVAKFHPGDMDTIHLLYVYQRYKDDFLVFNDLDRSLRPATWSILGAYWTHLVDPAFNWEYYYLFAELDDNDEVPGDDEARLHVFGARLFGQPHDLVGYSLEVANQTGVITAADNVVDGWLVDARLNFRTPAETFLDPSFMLEYTYLSGDEAASPGEHEGFYPFLGSGYPIWTDELIPNQNRGNWTNLHQYRAATTLQVHTDISWTVQYMYMQADEHAAPGRGRELGNLYNTYIDYIPGRSRESGFLSHLKFRVEGSWFQPGDFYADGQDSEWLRFQTEFTF